MDIDKSEIREVVLREPTLAELFQHGEPIEVTRTREGQVVTIEHPEILQIYLRNLVVSPKSTAILNTLPLVDAMRIKDEICGFFLAARLAMSSKSPKDSSSN